MATPDTATFRIRSTGLDIACASRGEGPLVLVLHGFPDSNRAFLPLLDRLAAAGHRAVAPALRGYAPGGIPADGDYRVEAYAKDAIAVADALGVDRFSIVGHDVGAATAYAAANLAPARVQRLVTAGIPHTGHFLSNLNPRQMVRSSYMLRFQLPGLAERKIRAHDFRWLDALVRKWSPDWDPLGSDWPALKDDLRDPARARALVSFFRQLPASLASPLSRRLVFAPVAAPTRMLYGSRDGCVGPEMFRNQASCFGNGLDLVEMTGAGHFMQWERPQAFAELVLDFLDKP